MRRDTVLVAVLLGAIAAAAFAPAPRRRPRVVVSFHVHAAKCDVDGASRPPSLKLSCG